jgi:hypothetical protein
MHEDRDHITLMYDDDQGDRDEQGHMYHTPTSFQGTKVLFS